MIRRINSRWAIVVAAAMLSVMAMSQGQLQILVVSGHTGSVPVIQTNGKDYVDVAAFAQVINGSLSFNGNQATLTLPTANVSSAPLPAAAGAGFSKGFLRAGIEEMSTIREWRSALTTAIENQYPFTQDGLARYQAQAATNLQLVQAAATTDADQNAASLIANEYQKMKQLSDKYLAKRANMSYISPNALTNDPLDQSIIACAKSLGAMAASGQFSDDGTCH
jgi:hypothetical protein